MTAHCRVRKINHSQHRNSFLKDAESLINEHVSYPLKEPAGSGYAASLSHSTACLYVSQGVLNDIASRLSTRRCKINRCCMLAPKCPMSPDWASRLPPSGMQYYAKNCCFSSSVRSGTHEKISRHCEVGICPVGVWLLGLPKK